MIENSVSNLTDLDPSLVQDTTEAMQEVFVNTDGFALIDWADRTRTFLNTLAAHGYIVTKSYRDGEPVESSADKDI